MNLICILQCAIIKIKTLSNFIFINEKKEGGRKDKEETVICQFNGIFFIKAVICVYIYILTNIKERFNFLLDFIWCMHIFKICFWWKKMCFVFCKKCMKYLGVWDSGVRRGEGDMLQWLVYCKRLGLLFFCFFLEIKSWYSWVIDSDETVEAWFSAV